MNELTIITPAGGDEPRVLDTDLAERLGMERLTNICARIIEPNCAELEAFGPLCTCRVQTGGRPGTAYYLNEEQALLVASLSRTERAKEVRPMLIRVFVAYRRGQLVPTEKRPQLLDFANRADGVVQYQRCGL